MPRYLIAIALMTLMGVFLVTGCSGGDGGGGTPAPPPPSGTVDVTANVSGTPAPGAALTANAVIDLGDGSTLTSVTWSQTAGLPAVITGGNTQTATVDLASATEYKDHLLDILEEPPVTAAQLPPTVPLPPGEFPGGLQDRFQVVGINPFALEETALVTLKVTVVTSSGTYSDTVDVHTEVPWKVNPGLRTVPVNIPVLLHGKDQATYDWALTPPAGSGATLTDATARSPWFTPNIPGLYTVTVTDVAAASVVTLQIFAGNWRGVIVGQDATGRPVPDGGCTVCHNGGIAPDKFTPWVETGHAEIFTVNLNTSTHYGSSCFPCHTVGYDPGFMNGGFDDASDYLSFMNSGLLNVPGPNWATMLQSYPAAAKLANIQCENCHGPQDALPGQGSVAHGINNPLGEPRVNLSSDVCAACHGEPLRHARFQQWQLSGHANYELAIDEGTSGSCSRCHTANGFLTWLPVLLGQVPGDPTANITVSWTEDETHPQTCATCHDPHAIGTTTGAGTNATVRISGDTPPLIAGFTAYGVGKGAICMTCHNSRRGLRNDSNFAAIAGTSDVSRAPHGSAQADVLMGENAYFLNVGVRGAHSFTQDTCVNCHMRATPPPAALSYNQGGTNHTFYAAPDICTSCHQAGGVSVTNVQGATTAAMHDLEDLILEAWLDVFGDQIALGNQIDLDGQATITMLSEIASLEFGESHGRQALTFNLANATVVGPLSLNDISVVQPTPQPALGLHEVAPGDLFKAGWNWTLIHNDSSKGVHYPSFVLEVLDRARDAVLAILST